MSDQGGGGWFGGWFGGSTPPPEQPQNNNDKGEIDYKLLSDPTQDQQQQQRTNNNNNPSQRLNVNSIASDLQQSKQRHNSGLVRNTWDDVDALEKKMKGINNSNTDYSVSDNSSDSDASQYSSTQRQPTSSRTSLNNQQQGQQEQQQQKGLLQNNVPNKPIFKLSPQELEELDIHLDADIDDLYTDNTEFEVNDLLDRVKRFDKRKGAELEKERSEAKKYHRARLQRGDLTPEEREIYEQITKQLDPQIELGTKVQEELAKEGAIEQMLRRDREIFKKYDQEDDDEDILAFMDTLEKNPDKPELAVEAAQRIQAKKDQEKKLKEMEENKKTKQNRNTFDDRDHRNNNNTSKKNYKDHNDDDSYYDNDDYNKDYRRRNKNKNNNRRNNYDDDEEDDYYDNNNRSNKRISTTKNKTERGRYSDDDDDDYYDRNHNKNRTTTRQREREGRGGNNNNNNKKNRYNDTDYDDDDEDDYYNRRNRNNKNMNTKNRRNNYDDDDEDDYDDYRNNKNNNRRGNNNKRSSSRYTDDDDYDDDDDYYTNRRGNNNKNKNNKNKRPIPELNYKAPDEEISKLQDDLHLDIDDLKNLREQLIELMENVSTTDIDEKLLKENPDDHPNLVQQKRWIAKLLNPSQKGLFFETVREMGYDPEDREDMARFWKDARDAEQDTSLARQALLDVREIKAKYKGDELKQKLEEHSKHFGDITKSPFERKFLKTQEKIKARFDGVESYIDPNYESNALLGGTDFLAKYGIDKVGLVLEKGFDPSELPDLKHEIKKLKVEEKKVIDAYNLVELENQFRRTLNDGKIKLPLQERQKMREKINQIQFELSKDPQATTVARLKFREEHPDLVEAAKLSTHSFTSIAKMKDQEEMSDYIRNTPVYRYLENEHYKKLNFLLSKPFDPQKADEYFKALRDQQTLADTNDPEVFFKQMDEVMGDFQDEDDKAFFAQLEKIRKELTAEPEIELPEEHRGLPTLADLYEENGMRPLSKTILDNDFTLAKPFDKGFARDKKKKKYNGDNTDSDNGDDENDYNKKDLFGVRTTTNPLDPNYKPIRVGVDDLPWGTINGQTAVQSETDDDTDIPIAGLVTGQEEIQQLREYKEYRKTRREELEKQHADQERRERLQNPLIELNEMLEKRNKMYEELDQPPALRETGPPRLPTVKPFDTASPPKVNNNNNNNTKKNADDKKKNNDDINKLLDFADYGDDDTEGNRDDDDDDDYPRGGNRKKQQQNRDRRHHRDDDDDDDDDDENYRRRRRDRNRNRRRGDYDDDDDEFADYEENDMNIKKTKSKTNQKHNNNNNNNNNTENEDHTDDDNNNTTLHSPILKFQQEVVPAAELQYDEERTKIEKALLKLVNSKDDMFREQKRYEYISQLEKLTEAKEHFDKYLSPLANKKNVRELKQWNKENHDKDGKELKIVDPTKLILIKRKRKIDNNNNNDGDDNNNNNNNDDIFGNIFTDEEEFYDWVTPEELKEIELEERRLKENKQKKFQKMRGDEPDYENPFLDEIERKRKSRRYNEYERSSNRGEWSEDGDDNNGNLIKDSDLPDELQGLSPREKELYLQQQELAAALNDTKSTKGPLQQLQKYVDTTKTEKQTLELLTSLEKRFVGDNPTDEQKQIAKTLAHFAAEQEKTEKLMQLEQVLDQYQIESQRLESQKTDHELNQDLEKRLLLDRYVQQRDMIRQREELLNKKATEKFQTLREEKIAQLRQENLKKSLDDVNYLTPVEIAKRVDEDLSNLDIKTILTDDDTEEIERLVGGGAHLPEEYQKRRLQLHGIVDKAKADLESITRESQDGKPKAGPLSFLTTLFSPGKIAAEEKKAIDERIVKIPTDEEVYFQDLLQESSFEHVVFALLRTDPMSYYDIAEDFADRFLFVVKELKRQKIAKDALELPIIRRASRQYNQWLKQTGKKVTPRELRVKWRSWFTVPMEYRKPAYFTPRYEDTIVMPIRVEVKVETTDPKTGETKMETKLQRTEHKYQSAPIPRFRYIRPRPRPPRGFRSLIQHLDMIDDIEERTTKERHIARIRALHQNDPLVAAYPYRFYTNRRVPCNQSYYRTAMLATLDEKYHDISKVPERFLREYTIMDEEYEEYDANGRLLTIASRTPGDLLGLDPTGGGNNGNGDDDDDEKDLYTHEQLLSIFGGKDLDSLTPEEIDYYVEKWLNDSILLSQMSQLREEPNPKTGTITLHDELIGGTAFLKEFYDLTEKEKAMITWAKKEAQNEPTPEDGERFIKGVEDLVEGARQKRIKEHEASLNKQNKNTKEQQGKTNNNNKKQPIPSPQQPEFIYNPKRSAKQQPPPPQQQRYVDQV